MFSEGRLAQPLAARKWPSSYPSNRAVVIDCSAAAATLNCSEAAAICWRPGPW